MSLEDLSIRRNWVLQLNVSWICWLKWSRDLRPQSDLCSLKPDGRCHFFCSSWTWIIWINVKSKCCFAFNVALKVFPSPIAICFMIPIRLHKHRWPLSPIVTMTHPLHSFTDRSLILPFILFDSQTEDEWFVIHAKYHEDVVITEVWNRFIWIFHSICITSEIRKVSQIYHLMWTWPSSLLSIISVLFDVVRFHKESFQVGHLLRGCHLSAQKKTISDSLLQDLQWDLTDLWRRVLFNLLSLTRHCSRDSSDSQIYKHLGGKTNKDYYFHLSSIQLFSSHCLTLGITKIPTNFRKVRRNFDCNRILPLD